MIKKEGLKRLFTFGCSFTRYGWTTWPQILSEDLDLPYWNYAIPGAGNQYMFNMLMQADKYYNFTKDDLIIICWTNVCREDRLVKGKWIVPGNIYTQTVYDTDWVRKFADPVGMSLRDYATINAADVYLQGKKCQYHFLSMLDITKVFNQFNYDLDSLASKEEQTMLDEVKTLFSSSLSKIKPSFYDVLWDNKLENKMNALWAQFDSKFSDAHPSPIEHYRYLETVLNYKFKDSTVKKVQEVQSIWEDILHKWAADPNRPDAYPHKELYAKTFMGNENTPKGLWDNV